MSEEDRDEEAWWDEIGARFPLEAFEPIAKALGKRATPQNLEALRSWLRPYFDLWPSNTTEEPSREERKKSFVELREAATTLLKSVRVGGGLWRELPVNVVMAAWDQQFEATVQGLADAADRRIKELSELGRTGRPAKNATFRELTPELVHAYEHLVNGKAKKPSWRGDSGMYGGAFYDFAVAVWRCLHLHLPEVRGALPASEAALAEELKNHWPKD
jgi:hypothetical protein